MFLKKVVYEDTKGALRLQADDLPLLIHGASKDGASLFTISLLANLFAQGQKILSFTAFPMARDEFLAQIQDVPHSSPIFDLIDESQINDAGNSRGLIVKSGNIDLFIKAIQNLPDIQERVVLVKNIETILKKDVFEAIKNQKRLILSGDFDQCPFLDELIRDIGFHTRIFFSQPRSIILDVTLPPMEKYVGYMTGQCNGRVTLKS